MKEKIRGKRMKNRKKQKGLMVIVLVIAMLALSSCQGKTASDEKKLPNEKATEELSVKAVQNFFTPDPPYSLEEETVTVGDLADDLKTHPDIKCHSERLASYYGK